MRECDQQDVHTHCCGFFGQGAANAGTGSGYEDVFIRCEIACIFHIWLKLYNE
jgi:hypothetical protein